jgi:Tfp pilus assembly major pilin PilA
LIEIIITVLVIAIIGAAVMLPFVNSLSGSPNPVWIQQASDLVQGELEQVIANKRASGFGGIATGASACSVPMPAGFTCSRSVCYVPAGNLNDTSTCATATAYKRVAVAVNHATVGDVSAVLLVTNP